MNLLRRALASELRPSSHSPRKCVLLLQQSSSLYSTSTSTRTRSTSKWLNQQEEVYIPEMVQKTSPAPAPAFQREEGEEMKTSLREKDWPRPSEIPWQTQVANTVNLIGYVEIPVQFQAGPNGKSWAGTIISQHTDGTVTNPSDTPPFWIPVIFEGDLAHVAASHLKVKDRVYIAGQLTADPPPISVVRDQANVQVMARDLSFVGGSSQVKQSTAAHKRTEPIYHNSASKMKDRDRDSSSWDDLLKNPNQWWDCRERKLNGLVKPKYPDFKHKDNGAALWLDSAPSWVVSKLKGVESDVQFRNVKQSMEGKGDVPLRSVKQYKEGKDDESWKNLVENPDKWWDNRLDKLKEKSPDFKHKDTGKGLWLSDSPAWVLPKLPPSRSKQSASFTKRS